MPTKKVLLIVAIALLTACNNDTQTVATDPAAAHVSSRQDLMKDWRFANDTLKGMTENPTNFDATIAQEQAKILADSQKMWAYFDDSAAQGKATQAVWSDKAGFDEAKSQFDTAVSALVAAAQTATTAQDIETALGQVGESCGSCHKKYKQ